MQNNFQNMFHFYDSLLRFMGKGPILMFVIMVPTLKKSTKPKATRRVLKLEFWINVYRINFCQLIKHPKSCLIIQSEGRARAASHIWSHFNFQPEGKMQAFFQSKSHFKVQPVGRMRTLSQSAIKSQSYIRIPLSMISPCWKRFHWIIYVRKSELSDH